MTNFLAYQGFSPGVKCLAGVALQGLGALQARTTLTVIREGLAAINLPDVAGLSSFLNVNEQGLLGRLQTGWTPDAADLPFLETAFRRLVLVGDALDYHCRETPGKRRVVSTKPLKGQGDLSLAYSPGVAFPCHEIARDPKLAYYYTNRGSTVYVISNGSAILGIGNLGALASKPVMEGKCALFDAFAGINAVDLEIEERDSEEFAKTVARLWPTMAGINLEDIAAPACFWIEDQLRRIFQGVPLPTAVFHDDQHGTAIIATAALQNALRLQEKLTESARSKLRIVIAGAGAAGISCAKMIMMALGIRKDQILMVDSKGVVRKGRKDYETMPEYKRFFAQDTEVATLDEALRGADVFFGLSQGNTVSEYMVASMADKPIIFAMANPDPEILPQLAHEARRGKAAGGGSDLIMATGRSDHPNQVNNVLGFPFIFRGVLDVGARQVDETMKAKAAGALAKLARQPVPAEVQALYPGVELKFGPNYIVPTPFDPRVPHWVAPAVAEAAVIAGVATFPFDATQYREFLGKILPEGAGLIRAPS